jgi:hypothetical protein
MNHANHANMIVIQIKDPTLCNGVLSQFIQATDMLEYIDTLLRGGCDPYVIDELRQLTTREQQALAALIARMQIVQCVIPVDELKHRIRQLKEICAERELLEYFVRHGADRKLIATFWKKSTNEVTELRRPWIGEMTEEEPVQPCKPRVREQIQAAWYDIQTNHADQPLRRQIFMLHQQFQQMTINTVYRIARECEASYRPHLHTNTGAPAPQPGTSHA